MNYNRVYASIVLRAQAEYAERRKAQKFGKYFELHHIIPKSLGGTDRIANRALLTAREHFICHWLLVKLYPVGTIAHNKMLMAFWRMQSSNAEHTRYIFGRAYEKLRIEFANCIGSVTSITQKGTRNSHYGTKWYTNYENGESKAFKGGDPGKPWVPGRYVFNGRTSSIHKFVKNYDNKSQQARRIDVTKYERSIQYARGLWNQYHYGNYYKLEDFAHVLNISKVALYHWFKKYIPIFSTDKMNIKRKHFSSNLELVGIYF